MKYLHCYFNLVLLPTGEIYHHFRYLIDVHNKRGDEVFILGFTATKQFKFLKFGNNIILILIPRKRFLSDLLQFLKIGLVIIRSFKPDIVFLHHFPLSYIAPLFKLAEPRIAVVKKYYGTLIPGMLSSVKSKQDKLYVLIKMLPEILSYVLPPTDLIFMVDDGTKGYEILNLLRIKKWFLIPQLIPKDIIIAGRKAGLEKSERLKELLEENTVINLSTINDPFIILYIARLDWWKGIDRLLTVAAKTLFFVRNKFNFQRTIMFLIAGGGSALDKYRKIVKKLGLDMQVIFLGHLNRHKLQMLMEVADIYLCLYRFSCVGVATLEAMINGIPSILVNSGDTMRLLGEGAIIVPEKDIKEVMPLIIIDLVNKPETLTIWREKAKNVVLRKFLRPEMYWMLQLTIIERLVKNNYKMRYKTRR